MTSSLNNEAGSSFNIEEILHIGSKCKELRKENNILRDSRAQSTELIRRLELDLKTFSEARSRDTKYIQELERELENRSQQIGYLQGEQNLRNVEANCLGEHVHSLELKLADVCKLCKKTEGELMRSNADCFSLVRELEDKEVELQNLISHVEKLEETVSTFALESECEIEGMKLDITALEQRSSEAMQIQEKTAQENARLVEIIEYVESQCCDSQKTITRLENENRKLKENLETSGKNISSFSRMAEAHLGELLENSGILGVHSFCRMELLPEETGINDEVLGSLLSNLVLVRSSYESFKDEMKKMSLQMHDYKVHVEQLKNELREEKLKANEEAEDLVQEMAEMRYEITGMLEQERKRRACVEQASLQRIGELEAQVQNEQKSSMITLRHFHEAQKAIESKCIEIRRLKMLLEGLQVDFKGNIMCTCGECPTPRNMLVDCFNETTQLEDECILSPLLIMWKTPVGIK